MFPEQLIVEFFKFAEQIKLTDLKPIHKMMSITNTNLTLEVDVALNNAPQLWFKNFENVLITMEHARYWR